MVDLEVRLKMLREEGRQPDACCSTSCIGHGSHPDPAGGLAPMLADRSGGRPVIAHVCGTPEDPQDARRQEATLRDAGVIVAPTNAAAARMAERVLA